MTPRHGPNAQRYLDELTRAIEADLGTPLPPGTTVVPATGRSGSRHGTCYPFEGRSAIWCDPDIADRFAPVAGPTALSADAFVRAAVEHGAERRGIGLNRILDGALVDPQIDLGAASIRPLDRVDRRDVELIATLRAAVSDADADEAELDVEDLDPHIVAAIEVTSDGRGEPVERILALAGARLATTIPFDDIAVITHPGARRRGLGASCVHALVEQRRPSGTPAMYRCEADNTGSDRIAQRLGFDLVQSVGSVCFDA